MPSAHFDPERPHPAQTTSINQTSRGPDVNLTTLSRQAAYVGRHYALDYDDARSSTLLTGNVRVEPLSNGLLLRHARVHNHHDMRNRATLRGGIKLILVLAGAVDVRFSDQRLPATTAGDAAVVNLMAPTRFERRAQAGTHETSLTLTLPQTWLTDHLARHHPTTCGRIKQIPHLAMQHWHPSHALQQWAGHATRQAEATCQPARLLLFESLAQAIIAEALPTLLKLPGAQSTPHAGKPQLSCIHDLANGGSDVSHMTIEEIAAAVGMSRSSLQRHFKACYGTSLQNYLRRQRLEQARRQLENNTLSVTEVAATAGYNSPANFATAFKRQFGVSPRQHLQRCSASRSDWN